MATDYAGDPAYVPWYRKSKDSRPFKLSKYLTLNKQRVQCTACFPWTSDSLDILWGGHAGSDPELRAKWKDVTKKWAGAIAVGVTGRLMVFPNFASKRPLVAALPAAERHLPIDHVAWAINTNRPLEPLLVLTVTSVILIIEATTFSVVGKLRGHGGPITSLCVHPTQPHLFATSSRDFTTRLHDLALYPVQIPNNPHWPPRPEPSLAGPAHGLHMSEPEGEGIGQCVAVMVGGRSGGHQGAVLCSAFHPSQPLIATGGMDRAVKIWRIPPSVFSPPTQPRLAREDKPLFSTNLLHKARVLSVNWLADDILTTHSAPALMRRRQEDPEDTYYEEGIVVVWQWLGYNRFFPPGKVPQKVMRGTASDYRNSESFKVLAAYHLPMVNKHCHVYRSLTHDPILLVPMGKVIRVFNMSQFKPRTPPKFPADDIVQLTGLMHLEETRELRSITPPAQPEGEGSAASAIAEDEQQEGESSKDTDSAGQEDEAPPTRDDDDSTVTYPPPAPLAFLFDAVEGWDVGAVSSTGDPLEVPDITSCQVGFDGRAVVGFGEGTLFIWRLQE